jgi:tetratricopeptide (TPR) repeat protein
MSGPKKADVEAALNVASNTQRQCAHLIAQAEQAMLEQLQQETGVALRQAEEVTRRLRAALAKLTPQMQRSASGSVDSAQAEMARVEQWLSEAKTASAQAQHTLAQVQAHEQKAERLFQEAEQEYNRAARAIRQAGDHYLHQEMAWAEQAQALYDRAAAELTAAARLRQSAQQTVVTALQHAQAVAATRLEETLTAAQREFARQRAAAEADLRALEVTLENLDATLLETWSDTPAALTEARQTLESIRDLMQSGTFEEAKRLTQAARQALGDALRSAAENQSAHEKREQIGAQVMGALEELGFDVSFESGSRTEPLRIAGQTPDPTGKGDFDIAIPLAGAVNFEVNTPEGDITCLAAVEALQKRLAARGMVWQTTHWGHAEGAAEAVKSRGHDQQTVQRKSQQQTTRDKPG